MAEVAYVLNTNSIILSGVQRRGVAINNAGVVMTVIDRGGLPLAGMTWPVVMTHEVRDPDGTYHGFLTADAELIAKQKYTAVVDLNTGGSIAHFEMPFTAAVREVCQGE